MPASPQSVFTGWMLFLPPSQQSIEGRDSHSESYLIFAVLFALTRLPAGVQAVIMQLACKCENLCAYAELFHTERAHVRNLKVMQQLFYRPMREDPAIPSDFVMSMFPNIDDMIELHGECRCRCCFLGTGSLQHNSLC